MSEFTEQEVQVLKKYVSNVVGPEENLSLKSYGSLSDHGLEEVPKTMRERDLQDSIDSVNMSATASHLRSYLSPEFSKILREAVYGKELDKKRELAILELKTCIKDLSELLTFFRRKQEESK